MCVCPSQTAPPLCASVSPSVAQHNLKSGGCGARTDRGRRAAARIGEGRRGVRRAEAATSPVLGQLKVAWAQELAQHGASVRNSG